MPSIDASASVDVPAAATGNGTGGSAGVVLSAGATLALGTVASRVLRNGAKRPRGVLASCDETAQQLAEAAAAGRQEKARRRARRAFDALARVVPDAATDAGRERALRATATRGAVALFNAVAKAQRKAASAEDEKPVGKAQFMGMLRGSAAGTAGAAGASAGARWLSDDFLTAPARKMKKFDTDAADADADAEAESGDDADSESESEVELEEEFEDEEEEELEEEDE